MKAIPFILFALSFEPTPDDWHHFGLPNLPALYQNQSSNIRAAWQWTERRAVLQWQYASRYGWVDPDAWPVYYDARWRARCYYQIDDLADSQRCWQWRLDAARKLHILIGPLDYARGVLPNPEP